MTDTELINWVEGTGAKVCRALDPAGWWVHLDAGSHRGPLPFAETRCGPFPTWREAVLYASKAYPASFDKLWVEVQGAIDHVALPPQTTTITSAHSSGGEKPEEAQI